MADNVSKKINSTYTGGEGPRKATAKPEIGKSRGSSQPSLRPIQARGYAWPSGPATEVALYHSHDWLVADKLPKRFWPPARKPLMARLTRKPEKPTDHEIVQWV